MDENDRPAVCARLSVPVLFALAADAVAAASLVLEGVALQRAGLLPAWLAAVLAALFVATAVLAAGLALRRDWGRKGQVVLAGLVILGPVPLFWGLGDAWAAGVRFIAGLLLLAAAPNQAAKDWTAPPAPPTSTAGA